MWKLKRGDEGIALVLTAIAMAALLACVSLAIDIGQTAASTRAVQNSADAAAVAAANDCARGVSIRSLAPYGNGATATCNMATSTAIGTASNTVDRLFGMLTIPTQRSATAKWGRFSLATSVPLAISACDFSTSIIILHGGSTCNRGPSGQDVPGGFGWLTRSANCVASRNADGTYTANTGRPDQSRCDWANLMNAPYISLFVFDGYDGHTYHVGGFAHFKLTGYSFQSDRGGTLAGGCPGGSSQDCIQGEFLGFVANEGDIIPGPCNPFPDANFGCKPYLAS